MLTSKRTICMLATSWAVAAFKALPSVTTLELTNQVVAPDGFARSATIAGGTFPAPLIQATINSDFKITVQDRLNDTTQLTATSIHWHGLRQRNSSWADGVAMVSQCPIVPGHEFTYTFNAQGQAGTYLFHSHYSTQYCDGLRGPLVIYDPNDPYKHMYDVDNADTVITLADWYHKPSPQHITTDSPDSTLINGLGRAWTNTTNTPLSVVSVSEGRRYRLRLVSMSCDPAFVFSIDGHNLTVIEVDGTLHQPYTVDSLTIFAGQRYSMILAATQPVNSYWIRALPVGTTVSLAQPFAGGINSGILRYVGAKVIEPTTAQQPSRIPLVESKLVPYRNAAAPGGPALDAPDVYALNLDFSTNFSDFRFAVNGAERDLPSVPVLLQILSGARSAQDIAPAGSYFSLPPNTVVQLSFPAGDVAAVGNHPMHLHGHTFSVVRSAGQAAHEANFVNPPQRDVVAMGSASDNVTIRFVTDNAGPWLLHCHIDWHLNAGFSAVFVEDTPEDIKKSTHPPAAYDGLCEAWDSFNGNKSNKA